MTYLSGKTKSRKKYLNIFLGLVAFALFVYFWVSVRLITQPAVEPVVHGYKSAKNIFFFLPSSFSTYFISHASLAAKNTELEAAVERLENQLAQKDAIVREGVDISAGTIGSSTRPTVVLYPLAEDMTHLYSTVLLSKGYKDSLEKGGMVYIRGQQAVCEIVEVYTSTSLCELLSKGGRVTEGVTSSSSLTLELTGQGGGNFTADMPKAGNLSVGESVYLRSNPSFTLGTIVSIKSDDQATQAKVYIRGAYNPATSQVFYMNSKYAP